MGISLWFESFPPRDRNKFLAGRAAEVLVRHNVITGATMAFRSVLRPALTPFPTLTEFIHDGWIGLVAAMSSEVRFINERLVIYRQHADQQLGAGLARWQSSRLENGLATLRGCERSLVRLDEFMDVFSSEMLQRIREIALEPDHVPSRANLEEWIDEARREINQKIAHVMVRNALPISRLRRLRGIIAEFRTRRYDRFSRGWQSALLDFVRK